MEHNPGKYRTDLWIDWCPGCGNFGILASEIKALEELNLEPSKIAIVSGIGCSAKIIHYINANGVHSLHGRAIPFAIGIKLVRPDLTVIVNGGDGDLLGIGAGHFVALGRRNLQMTIILHDNRVYGLTKGQAAPTLPLGVKTKALAIPNIYTDINPIALAISSGYTFVARAYAFDSEHLKEIIKKAIMHRGVSLVDVLQPCVTFNDIHTADYFKKKIYKLEDEGWDPVVRDPKDIEEKALNAIRKSFEEEKIPVGIFYENSLLPTYEERLKNVIKSYPSISPGTTKIEVNGKSIFDRKLFESVFSDFIIDTE